MGNTNISTSKIKLALSWIIDFILPNRCIHCRTFLESYNNNERVSPICDLCISKIPVRLNTSCLFCGAPSKNCYTCVFCIKEHYLDGLISATKYNNPFVEKIVKTLKYRYIQSISNSIAKLIIERINLDKEIVFSSDSTIITFVPLNKTRLRERGFNQAELIANKLSESLSIPILYLIKKTKKSKPQADIQDRDTRIQNAKNIFELNLEYFKNASEIYQKTILIIDDVSTTGATLDECAKILKKAGAIKVIGIVFAHG